MGGVVDWIGESVGDVLEFGRDAFNQVFIKPLYWIMDQLVPEFDIPDASNFDKSPTYSSNQIRNTISERIPVSRCYGRCLIGANKIRFNAKDDADLRVIFAFCVGEISDYRQYWINDVYFTSLQTDAVTSRTEYLGTRTQTPDARFTVKPSAYRDIAYLAITFPKPHKQVGEDPHVLQEIDALLCAPLAGGADAFTRNPAVTMSL